jgi:hypothetical protein
MLDYPENNLTRTNALDYFHFLPETTMPSKSTVFVPGKPFQPSLVLASKPTQVDNPPPGRAPGLYENVAQGHEETL